MEWILIVCIYAGIWSKGDSVTMAVIPGWTTEAACNVAGARLPNMMRGTVKEVRFICVKKG